MTETDVTIEFQRGWDAALHAVRLWHQAQAAQAAIQARRSRFPKNFERDAQLHKHSGDAVMLISPDDV